MYYYLYVCNYYDEYDFVELSKLISNKVFDNFITIPWKICSIINRMNLKMLKVQFKTDM
jgi:hypothetical protein